ncbi:Gfo/Idh/MocA family protein [Lysinibacter cavernae]|uniref:Putative dehydrogenase n=1 Tax=Lysinibacter cavernae TaxID=1640652 RepID=A0A7X5TVD2_9MICO|nr:Gfo/Idh/MocA family oxidoreductase [Lysinibacter cavernae]NIH54802.1 putative dehydrogenase [Lysinibacter cavernae]
MSSAVRVIVVGAGDFGARHVRAVSLLPEFELVGVADRDRSRAEACAEAFGGRPFGGLDEALDAVAADAVIIATPPGAHVGDLLLATSRGLPCLTEKPIVATSGDVAAVEVLPDEQRALVFPAHVSRFLPGFARLVEELGASPVRYLRALRRVPRERLDLHGEVHPAMSAMIHDIDLVRALIPAQLRSVTSSQVWSDDRRPFPQTVSAQLLFEGGALAVIDTSWTMPHARQYIDARLEVATDDTFATVSLPGGGLVVEGVDGDTVPDIELEGEAYGIPVGALATELRQFAAVVSGRADRFAVTCDDALWSIRVALEIAGQQPSR